MVLDWGTLAPYITCLHKLSQTDTIYQIDDDTIDQIFEFMVRDFSAYALQLRDKPSTTADQQSHCETMMMRPAVDTDRFDRVWQQQVYPLRDTYTMND